PKWQQYDTEISKIDESALGLLKSFGVDQKILDSIGDRGGIIKFANSNLPADKPGKSQWKNEDGSPMTEGQWFDKFVYSKWHRRKQNLFDSLTTDAFKKQTEKESALAKAKETAKETLERESKEALDKF